MSDSTGNARSDCPVRKGFRGYWWAVLMRAGKDAWKVSNDIGLGPIKLTIGFALTLLACIGGFSLLGETVSERILWAGGGLIVGLGLFLVVFMIFVLRTPWTFENEMVIWQDAKFDSLKQLIREKQAERAMSEATAEMTIANLKAENARLASHNPHVALLKQQVGKFMDHYRTALAMLRDLKGRAINLLNRTDEQCAEYLARNVPAHSGLFSAYDRVLDVYHSDDDESETAIASRDAAKYAKICNDRLERLGDILSAVS